MMAAIPDEMAASCPLWEINPTVPGLFGANALAQLQSTLRTINAHAVRADYPLSPLPGNPEKLLSSSIFSLRPVLAEAGRKRMDELDALGAQSRMTDSAAVWAR